MMETLLITGGAGFVGSSLALLFKADCPTMRVVCLDNLKRRGSELNLPRLKAAGVAFMHGDVRIPSDIDAVGPFDLMVECSAEPSALAGFDGSASYLLDTNLKGTAHCLEACRGHKAAMIFLSTSRVYPWQAIRELKYRETATRLELEEEQPTPGISPAGLTTDFPLSGARTLYGATKLASELLITEYADMYSMPAVVNRCAVLTGPWQMGKVDQGFMVLWAAAHFFQRGLGYFGFGGQGKQVRDVLHVRDLYALLRLQIGDLEKHRGRTYNVGGGLENSVSLLELTEMTQQSLNRTIPISSHPETRPGDIPWYVTDNSEVHAATGWMPQTTPTHIVAEIVSWLREHETTLQNIL